MNHLHGNLPRCAAMLGGAAALAAPRIARAADAAIRIGYINPSSGRQHDFTIADPWVLDQVRDLTKQGLAVGGKTYPVEILVRDNGSSVANNVAPAIPVEQRLALLSKLS